MARPKKNADGAATPKPKATRAKKAKVAPAAAPEAPAAGGETPKVTLKTSGFGGYGYRRAGGLNRAAQRGNRLLAMKDRAAKATATGTRVKLGKLSANNGSRSGNVYNMSENSEAKKARIKGEKAARRLQQKMAQSALGSNQQERMAKRRENIKAGFGVGGEFAGNGTPVKLKRTRTRKAGTAAPAAAPAPNFAGVTTGGGRQAPA